MSGSETESKTPVRVFLVGAGERGLGYSYYALENPELCKIVGVAEPRLARRRRAKELFGLTDDQCFSKWQDVDLAPHGERRADAVIIATQDTAHAEPAIVFANAGYDILLEKPMATSEEDCRRIVEAVEKNKVLFGVCHVLRYTPYTRLFKQLISSGRIGEVVSIQHLEPVGNWHFAHSYVRGNWRKLSESSPVLMAKSCHDIDWILYMMENDRVVRTSSFGSLRHFKQSEKPHEAGDAQRCVSCPIRDTCAYSATRLYGKMIREGHTSWPVSVIVDDTPTVESVDEALRTGPYGRCAYECDNDVCDNQVVNLQFQSGATASFSMVAFSEEICVRKTRIFGTKGELVGNGHTIRVFDFVTQTGEELKPESGGYPPETRLSTHEGADWHLMSSFVRACATRDASLIVSGPQDTLESHLTVFHAETARLENRVTSADLDW